jgi:hypothetical protein
MSESSVGDEARQAEPPRKAGTNGSRRGTWPHGIPALRIGNVHQDDVTAPSVAPRSPAPVSTHAPWYLRLLRLVVGLTLLVLAWCGALLVALLADSALQPARPNHVALDTAMSVLKMAGACWVGIATLAAIVSGAFSLSLALTNRDWR